MGSEGSKRVVDRIADVFARRGSRTQDEETDDGNIAPSSGGYFDGDAGERGAGDAVESSTAAAGTGAEDRPSESVDDPNTGHAVTDGGADGASPGEGPWAEDDPIVFGEDADSERGAAILDAVTDPEAVSESEDESAPPFADADVGSDGVGADSDPSPDPDREDAGSDSSDDGTTEDASGETHDPEAASGSDENHAPDDSDSGHVDPGRLDDLEARIGALETDHVQLDAQLTDVASTLAALGDDVEAVGSDVRQLVAVLGGIALATSGSTDADVDASDLADALEALDVDEAVAEAAAVDGGAGPTASTPSTDADSTDSTDATGEQEVDEPADTERREPGATEAEGAESGGAESGAEVAENEKQADVQLDPHEAPEGIHRGAGDPSTSIDDAGSGDGNVPIETVPSGDAPSADEQGPASDEAGAVSGEAGAAPEEAGSAPGEAPSPPDEAGSAPDEAAPAGNSARELVDPRTDAVSARLRQFREGFVDDPTQDLPTGRATDEFRFEKILLPTDGEAAPDLSNAELAKPYLETLPDGYAVDAVVLEWLDWLVSAADAETAARAVAYYESVEWITADVREELFGYLEGLGEPTVGNDKRTVENGDRVSGNADQASGNGDQAAIDAPDSVVEPPEALDLQDHLRSLQYVTELASGEVGTDGI